MITAPSNPKVTTVYSLVKFESNISIENTKIIIQGNVPPNFKLGK
jgi:hypothetical protein